MILERVIMYIYIDNISDKPLAIVNINFANKGYYSLNIDDIDIKNLNIKICDDNNKIVNFCNLSFKIELNIIYSNQDNKIEDNLIEYINNYENINI